MSAIHHDLATLAPIGPLTDWLDTHVPSLGTGPLKTAILSGGTSNVVLTLNRGGESMVLRRPPTIPPPGAEKGVLREARILTALNQTDVPYPHCYGVCDDPEVIGGRFYVMEMVNGWAPNLRDEKIHNQPPFDRMPYIYGIPFAIVDGLITLANVDHEAIGLADYGKPGGFLARQVDRWAGQLASYKDKYEGYEGRPFEGYAQTEAWLRAHVPARETRGIIHGDVGTPNMMFHHGPPPRLAAMIDWELSTIGDPMIDIGWFTGGMRDEDDPGKTFPTALQDPALFPTKQELARYYCAGTGRDDADFEYISILAKFKSVCLLEYKVAAADAGHLPKDVGRFFGRSNWAPTVFGTAAPVTGNAEILAIFGTDAQKEKYLKPLMAGDIVSCFSMTEPQGGADPGEFTCKAWQDGKEWVIEGEKWFSSNAKLASFLLVIAVTDADAPLTSRMSMFIVPAETPGIEFIRNVAIAGESDPENGHHAHLRYNQVRVPLDHMLGKPGEGFKVAQARLGGGRIHHAMRTVGKCQRAIDMMLERAVSRRTRGRMLGDHQMVQAKIADSIIELEQFRLLVLKTAWMIDEIEAGRLPHGAVRNHIGMCKVAMASVWMNVIGRALEIHGSLGISLDMPLANWFGGGMGLAFADGPTDVHKSQLARAYLKKAAPAESIFPSEHIPTRTAAAIAR